MTTLFCALRITFVLTTDVEENYNGDYQKNDTAANDTANDGGSGRP
jgi:hypothetical protein